MFLKNNDYDTHKSVKTANEIANFPGNNLEQLCDVLSKGALRGAPGNRGVILSQILRA